MPTDKEPLILSDEVISKLREYLNNNTEDMGNEDLYEGDVRNYYNVPTRTIVSNADGAETLKVTNDSYPSGKDNRRARRKNAIRRKKGRSTSW